jgi:signal transduction histidine kinase
VRPLLKYGGAFAAVAAATLLTLLFAPWMGGSYAIFFFTAVLLVGLYGGYLSGMAASLLATFALGYFFMSPIHSFERFGVGDVIRFLMFNIIAISTAALSAARRRAEIAQQKTLTGLRAALDTMQKVSGWPLLIGTDTVASTQSVLQHGANAVGAVSVLGVWESEEEPWVYTAAAGPAGQSTNRFAPADLTPPFSDDVEGGTTILPDASSLHPRLRESISDGPIASAPFRTENLAGRVYFAGLASATPDVIPAVEVVAREIGNSLDRLYVAERMRQLALREDRMRVSRDLHDGVLQALTGIRLELQDVAQDSAENPATHGRLLAAERALATEQRELRRFIDGLKPHGPEQREPGGSLVNTLRDLTSRLSAEWKTPITLRVGPPDLSVDQPLAHPLRLMVHEAVINALKHGHPSRVAVAVEAVDSGLSVTVTDDGRGFPFRGRLDHEAVMHSEAAPVTLRDRVAALNGRIAIDSGARGARVEIILPAV